MLVPLRAIVEMPRCCYDGDDHRVLVQKRKKKKRFPSESKKLSKKSVSIVNLTFNLTALSTIRIRERGQNKSGIYDWYGLFLITFSIRRETSSSSSSFVPRPCGDDTMFRSHSHRSYHRNCSVVTSARYCPNMQILFYVTPFSRLRIPSVIVKGD